MHTVWGGIRAGAQSMGYLGVHSPNLFVQMLRMEMR